MKTYVFADNCPADKIREYIENIISLQEEYIKNGKSVPAELLIPSKIELSPANIKFLLDSKFVDFYGSDVTGDVIKFYWKETEMYPALEVRTKLESDGKYYLTYIKEDARGERGAFEWDVNNQFGKKGLLTVCKTTDAPDDVIDDDEVKGKTF